MTRRDILKAGAGAPVALRAQPRPPNFLVIVADDHGWDDLGCYGHPVVQTPNLDRIGGEGVRFTRCFTTAPLCSPGRGAAMTGLYPSTSGVTQLVQGDGADALSMKPGQWTFAWALRALGYETAAARKWHLSTAGATAHGFDYEFPSRAGYLEESVGFLEAGRDRPFCLYFCPTHTHRPYRRYDDFPYRPDEVARCLPPYLRDTPQVREHYARYLSETSKMDQEIGRLLRALESSGELDRTVVVYLTDHGPSMHRAKFSLYEWGLHSSFLFRGPGVSGSGRVDAGLASTIDLAPTLTALAGGEVPPEVEGYDLSARLAGRPDERRRYVHAEHHERNEIYSVRNKRFKLIRNVTRDEPLIWPQVIRNWGDMDEDVLRDPYPLPRPAEELYDLEADPLERRNLIADPAYAEPRAELRRRIRRPDGG